MTIAIAERAGVCRACPAHSKATTALRTNSTDGSQFEVNVCECLPGYIKTKSAVFNPSIHHESTRFDFMSRSRCVPEQEYDAAADAIAQDGKKNVFDEVLTWIYSKYAKIYAGSYGWALIVASVFCSHVVVRMLFRR